MKRTILTAAFFCAVTIGAQAQTDKGTRSAPSKEAQPAQTEAVPAEKTIEEGSVEAPVPVSMATPEQLQKMEADSKATKAGDRNPPEKKAAAPKN
jgi:hypothetical protein